MNDQLWQAIRYFLIAGGSYLAGRGHIPIEGVAPLADLAIQVASGAVALASALWGLYVRWNTRTVTAATADRADVPTVSMVTGKVNPADDW